MRIAFLSPSLSRSAGGIFEIERSLARSIQALGHAEVEAFGLMDEFSSEDAGDWNPIQTQCFATRGVRSFGYSPALRDAVIGGSHDLLHLHALWLYTSVLADRWRRTTNRPLVVTPNGMLEPWALRNSRWKKQIVAFVHERRMLQGAAAIQANTENELRDIRAFGIRTPVAIIPNGVALPESSLPKASQSRTLLFLGRIHPKKGLSELIDGWARVPEGERGDWRMTIAGWDDGGHQSRLQMQARQRGVDHQVDFVGPQFGKAKADLLASSTAFILPSLSEGQPIAPLEAWSYQLPVIMTDRCNLPEGFTAEAAVRVEPQADSIARELAGLFRMTEAELSAMGARGRRLVERRFSWPEVARRMTAVYGWLLGGGDPPDDVHV